MILRGIKPVEFRSRPTKIIGERFYIYASRQEGKMGHHNPCAVEKQQEIHLPLYYTGLTDTARIREREDAPSDYTLNRDYSVDLTVRR